VDDAKWSPERQHLLEGLASTASGGTSSRTPVGGTVGDLGRVASVVRSLPQAACSRAVVSANVNIASTAGEADRLTAVTSEAFAPKCVRPGGRRRP
jgi:hypothetical protein